jgi:hypothetical protein
MKAQKFFRQITGFIFVFPAVAKVYGLAPFVGKERAIGICGPGVTAMAKWSLRFWVPKIKDAADFDSFPSRMKARFRLWKPFFDLHVVQEDLDTFKINVHNCLFCEAFRKLGMSQMGPYLCQGDWEMAKENSDKWDFQRKHQIGTGDSFCDHTYLRREY